MRIVAQRGFFVIALSPILDTPICPRREMHVIPSKSGHFPPESVRFPLSAEEFSSKISLFADTKWEVRQDW